MFGAELDKLIELSILTLEGLFDRNGDDWDGIDVSDLSVGSFFE